MVHSVFFAPTQKIMLFLPNRLLKGLRLVRFDQLTARLVSRWYSAKLPRGLRLQAWSNAKINQFNPNLNQCMQNYTNDIIKIRDISNFLYLDYCGLIISLKLGNGYINDIGLYNDIIIKEMSISPLHLNHCGVFEQLFGI